MKHDQDVNKAAWRIACSAFGGRGGNNHYRRTMAFEDARSILEDWIGRGILKPSELEFMTLREFERSLCDMEDVRAMNFT